MEIQIGASFVEEIKIFDEERKERYDNALALIFGAGRSPHCCLQGRSIAAKIGRRIHLVLQNGELGRLHLVPLQKSIKKTRAIEFKTLLILPKDNPRQKSSCTLITFKPQLTWETWGIIFFVKNVVFLKSVNKITHRLFETWHWWHVQSRNDCHQRIEISYVETFTSDFNPVFNHFDALLLFHIL